MILLLNCQTHYDALRAAKREVRVLAWGTSAFHLAKRMRLIAPAGKICCRCVLAKPMERERRNP
jgi:hypothetical protein